MSTEQNACKCGRSPTGVCVGLHNMTNEQYKKYIDEQKVLTEQAKPQFLKEG